MENKNFAPLLLWNPEYATVYSLYFHTLSHSVTGREPIWIFSNPLSFSVIDPTECPTVWERVRIRDRTKIQDLTSLTKLAQLAALRFRAIKQMENQWNRNVTSYTSNVSSYIVLVVVDSHESVWYSGNQNCHGKNPPGQLLLLLPRHLYCSEHHHYNLGRFASR